MNPDGISHLLHGQGVEFFHALFQKVLLYPHDFFHHLLDGAAALFNAVNEPGRGTQPLVDVLLRVLVVFLGIFVDGRYFELRNIGIVEVHLIAVRGLRHHHIGRDVTGRLPAIGAAGLGVELADDIHGYLHIRRLAVFRRSNLLNAGIGYLRQMLVDNGSHQPLINAQGLGLNPQAFR